MIGVCGCGDADALLAEFFELFKTPWEIWRPGRRYEVLLSLDGTLPATGGAKLLVVYGAGPVRSPRPRMALYNGAPLPLYGPTATVSGPGGFLVDAASGATLGYTEREGGAVRARIGYDLLEEVRFLLTTGQPPANAAIPTLDLHIATLRGLIAASGARLVEIPPAPEGYKFIACLTHDLDHPSIRRHRFDHTVLGFLERATIGSLAAALRGRGSARRMLRNWAAALKLPFVWLGLARDFWLDFGRYADLEGGARSTFFVIPFRGEPGICAPSLRAARYAAKDIAAELARLRARGCEVGLHGIDAWRDVIKGRRELDAVRRASGSRPGGVRMHWLYFNGKSAAILERIGASYDSSVGYNETIGFRAGTAQAYVPPGAALLLELPLHIMDTALFYPAYLNSTPEEARRRIGAVLDQAARFGGAITVNWHDRSIAPERLWGDFYEELLAELRSRGAWLASAGETAAWFRKRRSAVFEEDAARLPGDGEDALPGLYVRSGCGEVVQIS